MDNDIRYYRYMGYRDGSGKPKGYVIKCYTEEEYEYYANICGHVLAEWPADGI